MLEYETSNTSNESTDVLCLEGLFFIRTNAIKKNEDIVKRTFKDLYHHLNYN